MMLRKLLVVLGLMSIPFGLAQAQEVYFSISGRQAKVESGEKKGIYDIWIKPKKPGTQSLATFEVYDAGVGGFADVLRGGPSTQTTFTLYPFEALYVLDESTLMPTQNESQAVKSIAISAEQKYLNRWVEILTLENPSAQGWILRVTTDEGDDVNNFNVRFTGTSAQVYDLVSLDLSIGLYKTQATNIIQLKPLFDSVTPPSLVVTGEEDTKVRLRDAFGSVISNPLEYQNSLYELPNSWALELTGSKERLNNMDIQTQNGITPWIINPIIKENETLNTPGFTAVTGANCALFDLSLSANEYEYDIKKAVWFIENQRYTGEKVKHEFAATGDVSLEVLVPTLGRYSPLYQRITPSVFVNQRPQLAVSGIKTVISPSEILRIDASKSSDPENRPLSFAWFVDGVFRGDTPNLSFAASTSGEYKIRLLLDDKTPGSSCSTSDTTFSIRVNTQPYAEIELDEIVALGTKTSFYAASLLDSDGDSLSFSWSVQGLEGSSTAETVEINHTTRGTFEAVLQVNDGSGTNNAQFITRRSFKVNAPPVPQFTIPSLVAPEQVVRLNASSSSDPDSDALSVSWEISDGRVSGDNQYAISFQEPGEYTIKLTVNDGQGVGNSIKSLTKTIRVNDAPVPLITSVDKTNSADVLFKADQSKDSDQSVSTFTWDFGDGKKGEGSQIVHQFAKAGTYVVTLTVDDGQNLANSLQSITKTVLVNKNPTANFTLKTLVAPGENLELDARSSSDEDGSISEYTWNHMGRIVGRGAQVLYAINEPGEHIIELTVKDNSGFDDAIHKKSKKVRVNVAPVVRWNSNPAVTEPGLKTRFSASNSFDEDDKNLSFTWDFGDNQVYEGAEITHEFLQSGTFRFQITADDGNGLRNSKTTIEAEIRVNASPIIVTEQRIVSNSQVIELDATKSYDADGSPLAFTWILPDGSERNAPQLRWNAPKAGYYKIGLTVDDQDNLKNSRISTGIDVLINRPVVAVVDSLIESCTGQIIIFSSAKSFDPDGDQFSTQWDFGDGNTSRDNNPYHTYEKPGIYVATLTLSDGIATEPTIAKIPVKISGSPTARINIIDTTICVNTPLTLNGNKSTDPNGPIGAYSWDFGDESSGFGNEVTHLYSKAGVYTVQLTVIGSDGGNCSNTSVTTAQVRVVEGPEARFTIPEWSNPRTPIALDASTSILSGTTKSVQWVITNENNVETKLEGLKQSFNPPASGLYTIKLLVEVETGSDCNISFAEKTIRVNHPPVIAWDKKSVYADNQSIRVRAQGSSDKDGFILSYEWFLNDAFIGKGLEAQLGFLKPGTYNLELVVMDNSGVTSGLVSKRESFNVNAPPIADFTLPEQVFKGEWLDLKPSQTTDADNQTLATSWFVDGKRIDTTSIKLDKTAYLIKLVQNDSTKLANAADSISKTIFVTEPPNLEFDIPRNVIQGYSLSKATVAAPSDVRLMVNDQFLNSWTATQPGVSTFRWVWVPRDSVLASQSFVIQTLPPLALVDDKPEAEMVKWNPANPFATVSMPAVNRQDVNNLSIEWFLGTNSIGYGTQVMLPVKKGENQFTVLVKEFGVEGSKPLRFTFIVIAE